MTEIEEKTKGNITYSKDWRGKCPWVKFHTSAWITARAPSGPSEFWEKLHLNWIRTVLGCTLRRKKKGKNVFFTWHFGGFCFLWSQSRFLWNPVCSCSSPYLWYWQKRLQKSVAEERNKNARKKEKKTKNRKQTNLVWHQCEATVGQNQSGDLKWILSVRWKILSTWGQTHAKLLLQPGFCKKQAKFEKIKKMEIKRTISWPAKLSCCLSWSRTCWGFCSYESSKVAIKGQKFFRREEFSSFSSFQAPLDPDQWATSAVLLFQAAVPAMDLVWCRLPVLKPKWAEQQGDGLSRKPSRVGCVGR